MSIKIDNVPIHEIRESLVMALIKMASQGSVPAAQAVTKMISDIEISALAESHTNKMAELSNNPIQLCGYLGNIGEKKSELSRHLGRSPTDEEFEAYTNGMKDRKLQMRAIRLGQAKMGGEIDDWMKKG